VEFGVEAANSAWARLVGLSTLGDLQVVVDPDSWLAPHGWIGILVIGSTITASVPTPDLLPPVMAALEGLAGDRATTPDVVMPRLPPTSSTLGPAALFYPPSGFAASSDEGETGSPEELDELLAAVDTTDLEESGVAHIESPAFVSRAPGGTVAAACGYRRWPNGVAHLSALAHPVWRRRGHGRRAATAAIRCAIHDELLPQWRARPVASQALARTIGLVPVGAQLSLQPA
jgi:hypothetical protein